MYWRIILSSRAVHFLKSCRVRHLCQTWCTELLYTAARTFVSICDSLVTEASPVVLTWALSSILSLAPAKLHVTVRINGDMWLQSRLPYKVIIVALHLHHVLTVLIIYYYEYVYFMKKKSVNNFAGHYQKFTLTETLVENFAYILMSASNRFFITFISIELTTIRNLSKKYDHLSRVTIIYYRSTRKKFNRARIFIRKKTESGMNNGYCLPGNMYDEHDFHLQYKPVNSSP